MDALWNVEDKLKISTGGAITALVCTAMLAIVVCSITILMLLKTKNKAAAQIASHDHDHDRERLDDEMLIEGGRPGPGCWSGARKWDAIEDVVVRFMRRSTNKLNCNCCSFKFKVVSAGQSKLPVWQRPILMGDKCQLPGFSGLILYDHKGTPLPPHPPHLHYSYHHNNQVKAGEVTTQTLLIKELL